MQHRAIVGVMVRQQVEHIGLLPVLLSIAMLNYFTTVADQIRFSPADLLASPLV